MRSKWSNMKVFDRISNRAYLLLAVTLFAAANPIVQQLINLGEQISEGEHNPISFCNVLFIGNLCALIVLLVFNNPVTLLQISKRLTGQTWLNLTAVATLSGAVAPALLFTALDKTNVNNVILMSRIEPPLSLALAVWILGAPVNAWIVSGAVLSFSGVALTVLLQLSNVSLTAMKFVELGQADLYVVLAAIATSVSAIITKISLKQVTLGFFTTYRMAVGTLVFFTIVLVLFEPGHFTEAFSPLLWRWMVVYGAAIVVLGQLTWFAGLKRSQASEVSLAKSFNPIAGILAAYFILGQVPTMAQYIGGSVILLGMTLNQIGIVQQQAQMSREQAQSALQQEMTGLECGFKGV